MKNSAWFVALRNLLSLKRTPVGRAEARRRQSRAPAWQPEVLESRELLAADASLLGGILTLQGDATNNVATTAIVGT